MENQETGKPESRKAGAGTGTGTGTGTRMWLSS